MADDGALVCALLRAHLLDEPMSWVPGYIKVRWAGLASACRTEHVGGHWRRKAHVRRTIDALACVCKQPLLAEPELRAPPVGRKRNR
jgi:hypothetical protein